MVPHYGAMFGKTTLLGAVALSSLAVPAMASAPLAVTMPSALPLAAVGMSQADCAAFATRYSPSALRYSAASQVSKKAAILGGRPSALEALKRKRQGGNSILAPTNPILSPAAPAAPASVSYTPALPVSAIGTACIGTLGGQMKGPARSGVLRTPFPPPRSIGAFLGTERVAIARTRWESDWRRVAGRGLSRRDLRRSIGRLPDDRTALLARVNRWVNHRISYREDTQLNGRLDYWADARETLRRGKGDCEDYAILKMQILAAAGVSRDDMMLTLLRDTVRRIDHAVLLVRDGSDWKMLDLQTDRVVTAAADYGYSPLVSFSESTSWIHGKRVQQPQRIRIAYSN